MSDGENPQLGRQSLSKNFKNIFDYSGEKFLYVNFDKTFYIHISKQPSSEPLHVEGYPSIQSAKDDKTVYLGTLIIQSPLVLNHVEANIKSRAFNVKKYHDWLDVNTDTPIVKKVEVLYMCMFAAITYGCEAWFCINDVSEELLKIERTLLKRILGVRNTTPNDLVYIEFGIPDIISKIKKRQANFFNKMQNLEYSEALVRSILDMCVNLPCYRYYLDIDPNVVESNIRNRRHDVLSSESTYSTRYSTIVGFQYCDALYNLPMIECYRTAITRWRLSNHKLRIETGRYCRPKIPRNERKCMTCNVVEDEDHVLFSCVLYDSIRVKYEDVVARRNTIHLLLNPVTTDDACKVGSFILEVELYRSDNGLDCVQ